MGKQSLDGSLELCNISSKDMFLCKDLDDAYPPSMDFPFADFDRYECMIETFQMIFYIIVYLYNIYILRIFILESDIPEGNEEAQQGLLASIKAVQTNLEQQTKMLQFQIKSDMHVYENRYLMSITIRCL